RPYARVRGEDSVQWKCRSCDSSARTDLDTPRVDAEIRLLRRPANRGSTFRASSDRESAAGHAGVLVLAAQNAGALFCWELQRSVGCLIEVPAADLDLLHVLGGG